MADSQWQIGHVFRILEQFLLNRGIKVYFPQARLHRLK